MKLKLVTPPSTLAVSLSSAKKFFRVLGDDENEDIERVIKMATEQVEIITNRQIVQATYALYLDGFSGSVRIPRPPLVSVDSVKYVNTDGDLVPFTDFFVDAVVEPAVVLFRSYPTDISTNPNSLVITYTCGYTTTPPSIESYILNTALTRFENREGEVVGTIANLEIGKHLIRLLDSFRVIPV